MSNKVSFSKKGFKYFTDYKDNEKVKPSCIMLPKMSRYTKGFSETKYMSFLIKDDELLEKYNKIWDKINNIIKKGFDSEPVYNEKYQETKTKSYNCVISTKFCDDRIPKEGSHCICLSVILIDSVFKIGKSCCPQDFLEECKNIVKEKR